MRFGSERADAFPLARSRSRQEPAPPLPVPWSPLAQSVRLTPGCALLVVVLREPLADASPTVGVGNRPRRAIVDRLGVPAVANVDPSHFVPLFVVP